MPLRLETARKQVKSSQVQFCGNAASSTTAHGLEETDQQMSFAPVADRYMQVAQVCYQSVARVCYLSFFVFFPLAFYIFWIHDS